MKGDRVEVVVDVGDGETKTYDIAASKAGRRLETTTSRGIVEVAQLTRTGQVVRTARFMQQGSSRWSSTPTRMAPTTTAPAPPRGPPRVPEGQDSLYL